MKIQVHITIQSDEGQAEVARLERGPLCPDTLSLPLAQSRRQGERLCTAVVESMVNRVIGQRMAQKQPKTLEPAQRPPLLQIRLAVLDGALQDAF